MLRTTAAHMASAVFHDSRHYDTIVIGAGMSGLACAAKLYEHHHYQQKGRLLVLEARDRLGGRIYSTNIHGSRLDLGASWIHGVGTDEKPNPLMAILPKKRCRQLAGLLAFKAPEAPSQSIASGSEEDSDWVHVGKRDASVASQNGSDRVIPAQLAGPMMAGLWETIGALHESACSVPLNEAKNTTMLRALTKLDSYRELYDEVPKEYHHTISAMPQFIEDMEAGPLTAQQAEQSKGQVGMGLLEFAVDDFDGQQVFLQDGYAPVIDEIAKDLTRDGLVELGIEVTQIDWTAKPIVIETKQGKYSADQVVCTIPLGVLQHNAETAQSKLFQPQLPPAQQEAIGNLGFGTLDKIFAVYDSAWWEEEPFPSIWKKGLVQRPLDFDGDDDDDNDGQNTGEHADTSISSNAKDKEITTFDTIMGFTNELPGTEVPADGTALAGTCALTVVNLNSLTGNPALCAFISCATATHVESMSNDEAGGILHRSLTSWFGREPPKPAAVYVTRWSQDPFSRGSYSHMITGLSEHKHREAFQQPLVNDKGAVLHFAGEHTHKDHFAMVHGALATGWRAAEDVLKKL